MKAREAMRAAAVAAIALSMAACSGGTPHPKTALPPVATSAGEADAILTLLIAGQEAPARKRLKILIKRDPMNPAVRLLSDSLDRDPKELLGPESYPYVVRPGDTILDLAQRLLGNRLKAYQLSRYNALKTPIILVSGQTLRIPGELARAEPVRRVEPARPIPTSQRAKPAPAKPVAPVAVAKPAANPAAARQARTAGLAALNQGNVASAVGLLRRAAALDPGNAMIAHDLTRAERIAATVKARQ